MNKAQQRRHDRIKNNPHEKRKSFKKWAAPVARIMTDTRFKKLVARYRRKTKDLSL